MSLRVIGIKTLLIMTIDLLLIAMSGFSGILSALAFDREAWSQGFWIWATIGISTGLGSSTIGWWAWLQLRNK